MFRLTCCAVSLVLVLAARADAGELSTAVEFRLSSPIDHRHVEKKLDEGDALTGKALLKVRYYREKAWLFEQEVDLAVEQKDGKAAKYSLAKLESDVKLDRAKQLECHLLLPTTKGVWYGAVNVRKASQVLGSRPAKFRVDCGTPGNAFAKFDALEHTWPEVGTATQVNFAYVINIDRKVSAAVKKAKDDASRGGGEIEAVLELFDTDSKTLVHKRSLPFGPRRGLDMLGFTTNADRGDTFEAREGTPLLYRLAIPTIKGGAVLAEGEVTPWRLGSNQGRSSIVVEPAFRFAKAAPKPGVWGTAKLPAKAKAKPKKK